MCLTKYKAISSNKIYIRAIEFLKTSVYDRILGTTWFGKFANLGKKP